MSWLIPEEAVILCHWDAPSSDAIRAALDQAGVSPTLPIVQVREAFEMNPRWYAPRKRTMRRRASKSHAKTKR